LKASAAAERKPATPAHCFDGKASVEIIPLVNAAA
jgi:hypothetical protein